VPIPPADGKLVDGFPEWDSKVRRCDIALAAISQPVMQPTRRLYDWLVLELLSEKERVQIGYPLPEKKGDGASETKSTMTGADA